MGPAIFKSVAFLRRNRCQNPLAADLHHGKRIDDGDRVTVTAMLRGDCPLDYALMDAMTQVR